MRAVASAPGNDQLFAIAEGQDGYFTMAQALEAGFARSTHSYHVKAGNWIREHRGIYRLKRYPVSETGQLLLWSLWSLWSRDRSGVPQGVYSHETALALRDLSDRRWTASGSSSSRPIRIGRSSEGLAGAERVMDGTAKTPCDSEA